MKNVKKMLILFIVTAVAMVISGCSASYHQDFLQDPQSMHDRARVLIVTPENGSYGTEYYPTSGNDVVQVLTKELRNYTTNISVIPRTVRIEQIYEEDLQNVDYIIIPEILHWEDRATGWSFRPDRIEVRFDIYDNQRQLVNSVSIKGKSANIVWVQKAPNSLLPKPIRRLLRELFR